MLVRVPAIVELLIDYVFDDFVDVIIQGRITSFFILYRDTAFPEVVTAWLELELLKNALNQSEVSLVAKNSLGSFYH